MKSIFCIVIIFFGLSFSEDEAVTKVATSAANWLKIDNGVRGISMGGSQVASVELAKDWRTDKYLRRLEALMAVADKEKSFIISGTGDVLEPEDGIIGIGSGGNYALAAAKVLIQTDMSAEEIAKKSIKVASEICVFTNNNITMEKI